MINDTTALTAAERQIGLLTYEVGVLKGDLERARLQLQCEQMTITATIEMLNKRVIIE
jgi:hypothetical protein